MKKRRRFTTTILISFLAILVLISTSNAVALNSIAIPTPVISGLMSSYGIGDKVNVSLKSSGLTSKVQYKAVLINTTTKKSKDLLRGFTKKYYIPRDNYSLSFTVKVPGKYSLEITSRKGKYSKKVVKYFSVTPNPSRIQGIVAIEPVYADVVEGDTYSLPQKVNAVYQGEIKEVPVSWKVGEVNTKNPGTYLYEGNVEGYSGDVTLTLVVKNLELRFKTGVSPRMDKIGVTFNKNVDEETLKKKNFKFYLNGKSVKTKIQQLDNRRVYLLPDTEDKFFEKDSTYTLAVKGVKDTKGNPIVRTEVEFVPGQVIDKNLADTIKAGYLEAPEVYDPLGQFLYFGYIPLNADKPNADKDNNGIPLIRINGEFVYDPVSIAQYGLQEYSYYMRDGDKSRINKVLLAADWLVKNQDKSSGMWLYNFPFDVGAMDERLEAGWSSAMGQGQGMSLLVRAYYLTNDMKYLDSAELAVDSLKIDVSKGGLTRTFDGHMYFEEYPTNPPSYALNGFMFTLLGLYDLSYIKPDSEAAKLYDEGMKTLKMVLPKYDLGEKRISIYHLGHITKEPRSIHTSSFYHMVHIIQLKALDSVSPDSILKKYCNLWKSYME